LRQHNDYTRLEASYRKKKDCDRQRNARHLRTETVLRIVEQEPETIRVIAREHNLSHSTVQRILDLLQMQFLNKLY